MSRAHARQIHGLIDIFKNPGETKIVFLTGAGISVSSGIRTYRTNKKGIWDEFPEHYGTRAFFWKDPDWWYENFWLATHDNETVENATPNANHFLIKSLIEDYPNNFKLITQNVDGLDRKSGTTDSHIAEVHGRVGHFRCTNPNCHLSTGEAWYVQFKERRKLPRCPKCKSVSIPLALLFDERYCTHLDFKWRQAKQWVKECHIVVCIGTSGTVTAVSRLLNYASLQSAVCYWINPGNTSFNEIICERHFKQRSSIPELIPPPHASIYSQFVQPAVTPIAASLQNVFTHNMSSIPPPVFSSATMAPPQFTSPSFMVSPFMSLIPQKLITENPLQSEAIQSNILSMKRTGISQESQCLPVKRSFHEVIDETSFAPKVKKCISDMSMPAEEYLSCWTANDENYCNRPSYKEYLKHLTKEQRNEPIYSWTTRGPPKNPKGMMQVNRVTGRTTFITREAFPFERLRLIRVPFETVVNHYYGS